MLPTNKKRKKFLSNLKLEQIRALEGYESIVTRIRDKDPEAADSLSLLKVLISGFRTFPQTVEQQSLLPPCLAATSFDTFKKAGEAVSVSYNKLDLDHHWELRETDKLSDDILSYCIGKISEQSGL